MGNGEREHIASKACRWFVGKLLQPKCTQLSTGQLVEDIDVDFQIVVGRMASV